MKSEQIDRLVLEGKIPGNSDKIELKETHISWILLGKDRVFKIKKPVRYSFLDFSSLEKRKFYCAREIELNNRLTEGIYLDVQPVREKEGHYFIGWEPGEIIDYAVSMVRMDSDKQMDFLLVNNQVTPKDLERLAAKIALFHQRIPIIAKKDLSDIQNKFSDLDKETVYLNQVGHRDYVQIIDRAVSKSDAFNEQNRQLFGERLQFGFVRDCHGDLHTRNIFLLPEPQPFDCIEFNDDLRQIDLLNEVAFLCMDLDYFGRDDLAILFMEFYNQVYGSVNTEKNQQLFIYFKAYRANIRAKVNSLRARSSNDSIDRQKYLTETGKYLSLLDRYMGMLFVP